MSRRRVLTACVLAAAALVSCRAARSAGPEVRSLVPAGGQRGTTLVATFKGNFPNWPAQAWVDSPGLSFSPGEEKGTLNVTIAADAAPGVRWIRLYDAAGAAAAVPFVVGTLAEVVEKEPNNSPEQAQAAPSSTAIVNGRLGGGGDVDHFAVPLKQGQTLVASLAGHETLGSPICGSRPWAPRNSPGRRFGLVWTATRPVVLRPRCSERFHAQHATPVPS